MCSEFEIVRCFTWLSYTIGQIVFFLFICLKHSVLPVGVKTKLGFVSWPRRLFPLMGFVLTRLHLRIENIKKERNRRAGSLYECIIFIP